MPTCSQPVSKSTDKGQTGGKSAIFNI